MADVPQLLISCLLVLICLSASQVLAGALISRKGGELSSRTRTNTHICCKVLKKEALDTTCLCVVGSIPFILVMYFKKRDCHQELLVMKELKKRKWRAFLREQKFETLFRHKLNSCLIAFSVVVRGAHRVYLVSWMILILYPITHGYKNDKSYLLLLYPARFPN